VNFARIFQTAPQPVNQTAFVTLWKTGRNSLWRSEREMAENALASASSGSSAPFEALL
jgi:hypothetical protein